MPATAYDARKQEYFSRFMVVASLNLIILGLMSLFISSLNSGSNGNCYYIGNGTEAILVDAGISCKETEKRMSRLGLSMTLVKAIFVSHEHADHIAGIRVLSKKYRLPVYITPGTLRSAGKILENDLIRHFRVDEPVCLGALVINAFKKSHDAADPHSFMISCHGINIGVFTDIGICCEHVIANFNKCHAVFLESNYCEDMLMNGSYPYVLKKRISGGNGHLSNTQALDLFIKHRGRQLSHLVLSHLSKNNNRPELVKKLFTEQAGGTEIVIASRDEETPVFYITPSDMAIVPSRKEVSRIKTQQLSLFDS